MTTLTTRQQQVADLLAAGMAHSAIAQTLGITRQRVAEIVAQIETRRARARERALCLRYARMIDPSITEYSNRARAASLRTIRMLRYWRKLRNWVHGDNARWRVWMSSNGMFELIVTRADGLFCARLYPVSGPRKWGCELYEYHLHTILIRASIICDITLTTLPLSFRWAGMSEWGEMYVRYAGQTVTLWRDLRGHWHWHWNGREGVETSVHYIPRAVRAAMEQEGNYD